MRPWQLDDPASCPTPALHASEAPAAELTRGSQVAAVDASALAWHPSSDSLAASACVCPLSALYTAPEVQQCSWNAGRRGEMWSLGVTIWECCVEALPPAQMRELATMTAQKIGTLLQGLRARLMDDTRNDGFILTFSDRVFVV